ncbi:hypothetical protein [Nocardioides sp. GY 10113]|uniref:hypothetical protein n=1 Tax=Nocardioides sp. GY 10113 TaxID=2569761 RepID=UPI00197EEEF8|nr:hypothetical protein [Nocardioides sp. GY 10113]
MMLPVYQREAMWLFFEADEPAALQVGVGRVRAVSGNDWALRLSQDLQSYAPVPEQPWHAGINAGDGFIRQVVAVPLGHGATVEAQVRGEEVDEAVQLRAIGLTAAALAQRIARPRRDDAEMDMVMSPHRRLVRPWASARAGG